MRVPLDDELPLDDDELPLDDELALDDEPVPVLAEPPAPVLVLACLEELVRLVDVVVLAAVWLELGACAVASPVDGELA